VSSASAPVSARPQGRAKFVASATLLLALAGVASAGSATALGLSSPVNAPPLPGAPITSLPSLPSLSALPKAPTVAIPAPVTNATAAGGAVSSGGQAVGSAVGSAGSAVGGTSLPAPVGGAVSSAGTAIGGAVSGGTAAVGGAISGGASIVGGTVGGVGGTVGGVVSGVTGGGPVGGTTGTLPIPGIPVLPNSPTNPLQPGTGAGSTPISGASPFATTAGSKGAKRTAASSTLGPAGISLAQAWGSGPNSVLTSDLLPSSAAETSVVAVPAPMLAAAAQSSQAQDGDLLGFVSRHALPGLLVAIATALVGFVAAGNIKAFEPKFAALSLRLHALDARAKASVQRFAKTASTQVKG
jgi:hypothetical protein